MRHIRLKFRGSHPIIKIISPTKNTRKENAAGGETMNDDRSKRTVSGPPVIRFLNRFRVLRRPFLRIIKTELIPDRTFREGCYNTQVCNTQVCDYSSSMQRQKQVSQRPFSFIDVDSKLVCKSRVLYAM